MTPLLLRGRFLAWAVAVPLALLSTACGGQKAAGAAAADCPAGQVHCTPVAPCDPGAPGPVTAIVSGDFHVCALFTNGTVRCWGDNRYGQLGVGVSCLPASGRPLPVSNLCGVRALAAGNLHTCALLDDGTVKCWGATGIADTKTPMTIDAGPQPPCPIITSTGAAEMFGSSPGTVPGLTGPTAITAGALTFSGPLPPSDVTNNGLLTLAPSASQVYGNVISGPGAVSVNASAVLNLSGTNLFTGNLTNNSGFLILSNNSAAGSGTVVFNGGFVVVGNGITVSNNFYIPSSTTDLVTG